MYSNMQPYIPDRKPPIGALLNPYLLINRGIVGCWPFWSGSGNKVFGLSGNNDTGTLTGTAPSWTSGKFGSVILLPGTDEYIDLGDKPLFDFTDGSGNDKPYTLMGWLWIDDITRFQALFSKVDVDTKGWMLYTISNFLMVRNFQTGSIYIGRYLTMTAGLYQAQWIHLAVTYDGSETNSGFKIYRNGIQVDTDDISAGSYIGLPVNTQAAQIGAYANLNVLSGKVGNTMFYNYPLLASEISLLYREPFCGFRWMSIEQLAEYYEEVPPEIQALYIDLSTQIWTIKHAMGVFTKL